MMWSFFYQHLDCTGKHVYNHHVYRLGHLSWGFVFPLKFNTGRVKRLCEATGRASKRRPSYRFTGKLSTPIHVIMEVSSCYIFKGSLIWLEAREASLLIISKSHHFCFNCLPLIGKSEDNEISTFYSAAEWVLHRPKPLTAGRERRVWRPMSRGGGMQQWRGEKSEPSSAGNEWTGRFLRKPATEDNA